MTKAIPPIDRILAKVTPTPGPLPTPCWVCALTGPKGYSLVSLPGRQVKKLAHRVSYEHFIAPIPVGLQIDHLCRVPKCVNPAHLEPVTARENFLRGTATGAMALRTGCCKRGHSLDGAYLNPVSGARQCRTCIQDARGVRNPTGPKV